MDDTTQPDFITNFIDTMNKLKDLNTYEYDNDSKNNTQFYNTVKSDLANIKTQIDEILKLLTDLHNTIVSSSNELSSNVTIIVQLRKEIAILKQQLLERSVDNNGINPETNTIKSEIEDRTKQITQLLQDNAKYTQLIKESTVIMNKSIEILQKLQKNTNAADQTDINTIIKQITDSVKMINNQIQISENKKVNLSEESKMDSFYQPTSDFSKDNPGFKKLNPSTKPEIKKFEPYNKDVSSPSAQLATDQLASNKIPSLLDNIFGNKPNPLFSKSSQIRKGGTRRKRKSKKQKRKTKKPKRKTQKKKRKTHRKH
jgi:uncharacterized protein involved in exopolysaccharide biosynthesis